MHLKSFRYLWMALLVLSLTGCAQLTSLLDSLDEPAAEVDDEANAAASAQGILHFKSNITPSGTLKDLVSADVYIVYTNLTENENSLPGGSGSGVLASMSTEPNFNIMGEGNTDEYQYENKVPQHITDFNNTKIPLVLAPNYSLSGNEFTGEIAPPSYNVVGTTTRTWTTSEGTTTSTLRGEATLSNGKKLYVWVNDGAWTTSESTTQKMTPTRVGAVLNSFGTANPNIYDLVRKVYGNEWGAHPYGNLISNPQNEIHVVYYDIDGNGAWGTLGYFWGVNNILDHPNGNNALVFFMDSPTMGLMEGGTWDLTLRGPGIMMTTLAHEFQHMIHFYEKQVLNQTASPSWFNEMSSTASEDILAYYITGANTGPNFGDGNRLSQFAKTPVCTLTNWSSTTSGECTVYDSYAHVSSFGSFLARHYGGENFTFFRELLSSNFDNTKGIGGAIKKANNRSESDVDLFAEAFSRWGASIVLNPAKRTIPEGYGYPAVNINSYFGPGEDLIMNEASIWGFSSTYHPRIYKGLPAKIRPLSHIVYLWKENVTTDTIELNTVPAGASDLYQTIVVQAH